MYDQLPSLEGSFLIATSLIGDSFFKETVIFIVKDDEQGSVGLIINKVNPMIGDLKAVPFSNYQIKKSIPVFMGGPVKNEKISFLHTDFENTEFSFEVLPNLFWGFNQDTLEQLIKNSSSFRIFSGYSSWFPGQLEEEIKQKAWIVSTPLEDLIFDKHPKKVWRKALEHGGSLYTYFVDKVKDPLLN